jgi:nuclear cap-binding protein subunit 1
LETFRAKADAETVEKSLDTVREFLTDATDSDLEDTKRDVLFQCVLMLGSKSFSHVLNIIER